MCVCVCLCVSVCLCVCVCAGLTAPCTRWCLQIQKAAGQRGVRLIVEMLANVNLNNDLKVCITRHRARVRECVCVCLLV